MGKKLGTRKQYTEEFKAEAVKLCEERPVLEVAESLGVHDTSLYKWMKAAKRGSEESVEVGRNARTLEQENRSLRRENERLREEAEILKKASAYFAKNLR